MEKEDGKKMHKPVVTLFPGPAEWLRRQFCQEPAALGNEPLEGEELIGWKINQAQTAVCLCLDCLNCGDPAFEGLSGC
ncbi:Hypothetical predicted protein [Podarcis lilfordi]|uniref:Uncharacterized protein n=1 Tax=Podarcis lilfordi TaxID=74358 RepID=A0AA35LED2_9SAUR|nr:Hypothetical predicted protein [Podarcis lilfordi]